MHCDLVINSMNGVWCDWISTNSFKNISKTFPKSKCQSSKTIKHIFACILKPHKIRKSLFSMLYSMILWWTMLYSINCKMKKHNMCQFIFILGYFRIFPNKNPKLFHSHFEKRFFSKTFQVLENGIISFCNFPNLSKTCTNPDVNGAWCV